MKNLDTHIIFANNSTTDVSRHFCDWWFPRLLSDPPLLSLPTPSSQSKEDVTLGPGLRVTSPSVLEQVRLQRQELSHPAVLVGQVYLYYQYLNTANQVVEDELAWYWDVGAGNYSGMNLRLVPQHDALYAYGRHWCDYDRLIP